MKTTVHIFRKDTRRFWWEATVTLAVLAALTWVDSWRSDFTPGSAEGWLNILLPFAWAYLIALAVLEDPLVGDRQFWVTLPCRWTSILAAKAAFVLAFIHIPYLISCGAILAARGFSPLASIPQLLAKQLLLLVCLTLPAVALSAVVRNVIQFLLAAVLLMAAAILLGGGGAGGYGAPWIPLDLVRDGLTLLALTVGALAVVFLQFARRTTSLARIAGITAIIVAAAAYSLLPLASTLELQCAMMPHQTTGAPPAIRLLPGLETPPEVARMHRATRDKVILAIPVALSGVPVTRRTNLTQLDFQIDTASGPSHSTTIQSSYRANRDLPLVVYLVRTDEGRIWQLVQLQRAIFDELKGAPVTIRGTAAIDSQRAGATASLPIGRRDPVPGNGICSSALVEVRPGSEALKVVCESPSDIPFGSDVTLMAVNHASWNLRLGSSMTGVSYPRNTWLSPLHRRDAFFHLTAEDVSAQAGSRWLAPVSAIDGARIAITPVQTACDLITYELPGISLSGYLVK